MNNVNFAPYTPRTSSASEPGVAEQPKADLKDMFLQLLVAQLKNQDPLAPQDGAQFATQLAQFNSLDQLVSINTRLDQLIEQTRESIAPPAETTTQTSPTDI
jgi:flagellar basal-body rod modification protein FlgD